MKLIILKSEELASIGISSKNTDNFIFQGKEFHLGPTFSLKMRAEAIAFCEKEESQGYECLLVERTTAVTVWRSVEVAQGKKSSSKLDKQAFIERCRQELAKSIGPMSNLIIDELLNGKELLTPDRFVDRAAEQIPNPKLAQEFKQNMQKP
jgi:hypothetical protein